MDRRTKILAGLFGGFVFLGFVDRVIWPRWIDPILSIDDRIADRQKTLDALRADQEAVERGVDEYKAFAARVGSFKPYQVQTAILDRLSTLIEKNKLENVNVTPARPKVDSKTGLTRMVITVKGVATLRNAVTFLQDVAELPQLARIGNAAISPASQKRRRVGEPKMNLRIPVEVLVIPQQKVVGPIDLERMERPTSFVRHSDRNYSQIWDLKPFSEYIPPKRLIALPGKAIVSVPTKTKTKMRAKATGGVGNYTCLWQPPDRLSDENICDPTIDISEEFEQVYTLHVTDEAGNSASATKKVSIKKRAPPPERKVEAPPPPPPPPVVKRWKDGQHMQLRMAVLASSEAGETGEMAVYNKRIKQMKFYGVGDDFDGGELVYVHPTGAVARRSKRYFIYPIGFFASEDVAIDDADELFSLDYPRLVQMADWMKRRDEAKTAAEAGPEAKADAPAAKVAKKAPGKPPVDDVVAAPKKVKGKGASELRGTKKAGGGIRPVRRRGGRKASPEYPPLPADVLERLEKEYAAGQKKKAESKGKQPKGGSDAGK
ncbi:MAG: hypothetical protein IID33_05670 [Planctomycetes bacterium]|nr:hypothetical protein [Planctomycetota bacterium]